MINMQDCTRFIIEMLDLEKRARKHQASADLLQTIVQRYAMIEEHPLESLWAGFETLNQELGVDYDRDAFIMGMSLGIVVAKCSETDDLKEAILQLRKEKRKQAEGGPRD